MGEKGQVGEKGHAEERVQSGVPPQPLHKLHFQPEAYRMRRTITWLYFSAVQMSKK